MYQVIFFFLMFPFFLSAQTVRKEKVWDRLKFFEGKWEGAGVGQPGNSTVQREYQFVLNSTFLFVKNKSTYAAQEKNPKGEVHEDWGVFSRDRTRKLFVLRQFHVEGFVNQYTLDTLRTDSTTISFTTEAIENIESGWKARETYEIPNNNEFIETFELAEPGKKFETYVKTRFVRIKK